MSNNVAIQQNAPAGFFIRFLAFLIDRLIICLPFLILGIVIVLNSNLLENLAVSLSFLAIYYLIIEEILWYFYQIFMTHYLGGSLGKEAFGLTVINEEGKSLSLGESAFRYIIGYTVSSLALGLGFLWMIKDKEKRSWHDMLIGSRVVIKEKEYLLGILSLLGLLLIFMVFAFILVFKIISLTS